MIEAQSEPLSRESEQALRRWLQKPERKTLELIVSSKVKVHQTDALKNALRSDDASSKLFEASIKEARRYEHFLEIMAEVESATKLEITKVK